MKELLILINRRLYSRKQDNGVLKKLVQSILEMLGYQLICVIKVYTNIGKHKKAEELLNLRHVYIRTRSIKTSSANPLNDL